MSNFDTIMNIVRGGSAGSTSRKKKNSNFDNIMSIVRGESSYTQPAQTAYTPDAAARSIYENQMQTYFNQRTADVEARRKGEEYDTSGFAATEAAIRANPLFSDYEDQFDNLLGNISFNEDLNTYTARQQQNLTSGREHINDPEAARLEKRLKEDPRWAEVSKEVDSFISGLKENRKARAAMAEALGVDFGEIKSALGLVTENGEYKSGEQLANDIIGLLGEREEAGKESYESSRNFFTDALLGLIQGAGLATMGGRIKDARNEEEFEKNKQERIDGINRNIDILTKFAHTFAGSEFEDALYRRQQEGQTRLAEFAGQAAAAQNEEDSRAAKSAAEAEAKSLKELQKLLSGYGTTQEQLLSLNAEEIQKKIDELEKMKLQDPEGAYESEAARQRNIENTNAQMGIYSENAGWEALAANERDTALSLNSYIDSEISRLGQLKRLAENLKKTEEMQKSAEKLPAAELTEESLSLLGEEDRLMLSYMLGGRDAAEGVKMDTKSKALERVSEGMSDMQREEYLSGLEQEAENRRSSIIERIEAQASVRNTAEMTDAEKQTYAKLFLNKGAAAAAEYLDAMQDTLNARAGSKAAERVKGKWLAEGMAAFGGGVDQFFSGISQRLDTQLQPISKAQYASAEIRENLEKNEKSTALYDITSSVGNMAPAIAGSILLTSALGPAGLGLSATAASTIGSAASSVMMGASASGNAYAEALRQGYSEEQANSYSIMVGASEAALQYALGGISKLGGALSLGKIGTKIISRLGGTATRLAGNAFVQTAVKIAGNAVSEGIEEYLQTHLEKMFRNISFYEDNEIDPFDEEAIYSGVLGMITGGLLESFGTIKGTNKYKQLGAELTAKGLKAGIVDAAINSEMETASLARLLKDGKIRGIGNESYALGRIAEEFMQADAEGWKRITSGEQINKSSYKDGIHTRGFDFDKSANKEDSYFAKTGLSEERNIEYEQYVYNAVDGPGLNEEESFDFFESDNRLIQDLMAEGMDAKGFIHRITDNDIRHILNRHGIQREGTYGINEGDIKAIPFILKNYTDVRIREKNGKPVGVIYAYDGVDSTYYVEGVPNGNVLQGKQMLKVEKGTVPKIYQDIYGKERSAYAYPNDATPSAGDGPVPGKYAHGVRLNDASDRGAAAYPNDATPSTGDEPVPGKYVQDVQTYSTSNNNIPETGENSQENVEETEYKDKRAVLKYKSFDSYALNYKLNNNVELDETESAWSNELSSALSRIPDYKERTYRTLTFDMQGKDAYDNFIARHSVGEIVTYEGFTSSAKTKDGYPIEGERNVFLKIDGLHGKEINSLLYDNTDAEGEVLFDKKSQFIVQSVYEENGMLNIELKEIDYEIGREEQVDSSGRGKDSSVQQVRSQKNGTGRGQDSEVQGVSEGNPEGDNEGGLQSLREALPGGQRDIGREETGEEIGKDAYGRTYEEFDKKTDRKRKVISGDSIRESISQLSRDIQDTAAANGISSKELTKARLIADGTFSEEDISARDNKNVILDIAELYRKRAEAEASYTDIVAGQAKTEPGETTPDRLKKRMYDAEARANEVCLKYQLTKAEKIAAKKLAIDPDYIIPEGLSAENVKKGAAEWEMAYAAQREYMQSVDWVPLNRISRDSSKDDIYNAVIETENLSFRLKNEIAGFAGKHSLTESQKEAANQIANGHYDIKSLKLENKKAVVEYAELLKRKRTVNESLRKRRRSINEGYYNIAEELTANSDSWKDFPAGVGNIRGMQRTFESAAKNDPNLSKITDIFRDVTANEAERNRLGNAIKEPISKMKLTYMENVLVQMVGEELISADDAVKLAKEAGDKKATKERIIKGAELLRKNYDTLFNMLNRKLVETGNKPIGHIDNYFAHFNTDNAEVSKAIKALGGEPGQSVAADNIAGIVKVLENSKKAHDSFVSNLKEALGEDIIKAEGLPAYLEGNTANRKPQKAFSKHILKRMGDATELHASKGFDIYYDSVSKLIFHTDDIKTLRAMETVLREKNAPKDIQEQIKNLRYAEDEDGNPISYEERTNKINELMEKQGTGPSGIINALGEYTNLLAGKKSMYDRPLEADITRKGMLLLGKAYSNVGVNMILGNISSALTNFIPAGQLMGEVAPMSGLKGLYSTAADIFRRGKSGFTEQSDFLTNRKGTDSLYKSKLTKVQNIAMKPMEIVDRITSQWVTRSFYFDAVRQGMDAETAMEYADRRAARLIGDRSLGAQPAIYSSQSRKLFTQFQYEVFNFFDHYIHDMPMEVKSMAKAEGWDARQTAARLAASYAGSALGIYIVNEILRAVRGSGAGFDPIDETKEIIEGINEGKSAWDILKNVAIGIAEETPFIGTWLGGGRYPGMSPFSNFDSIGDFIEGFKDLGKRWPEYTSFLMYFNPFGGYNQVKKTIEGTASAINGGVYGKKKNSEGKYEDYLKYSTDGAWEIIQSVLFGKSSTQSAQEYYDDISMSLTPKETEYYKKLDSVGMDKHEFVLLAAEISGLDEYEKAQYISAEYAEHEDFLYEAFVFNDQMREQFDRTAGSLKAKAWYELHTAESMTDDQTDAEVKAQMADGYGLSEAETERIYYNEVLSESQRETLDGLNKQGVEISAREFFGISSAKALKDEYGDNISGSKEAAKAEAINELGIGFADAGKVAEAVGLDEKDLYSAYEPGETPEAKKAVIEACTAAGMSEEAAKNFYKQIKSAAKPEKMRLITENKALNEQQKAKAAAAAFTSDKEKAVYELAVSTGAMGSKLMKVYAEFKMEETGKGENLSREEMKSFLAKKGLNVWQVNTIYLLEASDKKEYNRRLNVMLQKAQMSADKKMEIKGVLWRK